MQNFRVLDLDGGKASSKVSVLWLRWLNLKAAHTFLVFIFHISYNSDVSLLTPSSAPGVLDNPVVSGSESTFLGTHTNKEYTVVQAVTAEVLDNSTVVVLPADRCSINSDCNGSGLESGSESTWASWFNVIIFSKEGKILLSNIALSIFAGVWVMLFGFHLSLRSILEGEVHEATIASVVSKAG